MRFYGIPSEDRVLEIIEGIKDGAWVLEEDGKTQTFDAEGIKERLRELVYMVKGWKEQNKYLPTGTVFFFVSTPDNPQAFKVYDLSSLGCSTKLDPARWRVYKKELLGQV